ncbi:MAG TPA: hypothetical protein DGT21_12400 [Armatimonadetes bacterium]|nr:hypothetical protein [Armatimonadota bacterium]
MWYTEFTISDASHVDRAHDCAGGTCLNMPSRSATIGLLICFSLLLCSIAAGEQEAADYGDFIEQPSSGGAAARTHTWSTTPSGDGEIGSTDKIEQNELLATEPTGKPEVPVTELASEVLTNKQDDSGDMLARLLSGGGGPPAPGAPGGGRMKKALAGGLVALLGAAIGVGVALLRARYGKTPDPARNVRVIRGQSPTPPRTGGRRML